MELFKVVRFYLFFYSERAFEGDAVMKYRIMGKTGERVSALGFGMMRLPIVDGDPSHIDEPKAAAMLHQAIDQGINYIDTAYPYHGTGFQKGGQSEPFVGRALKGGYREKVKLATKLPSWLVHERGDFDRYLDEQLNRLQTSWIDFYLIHTLDRKRWPQVVEAGVFDFIEKALKSGKIKHIGFSFHDQLSLFKEIVDAYPWDMCQIQYNYLDENYQAGTEGLKYAASKGLGVVIMEPLRGGSLVQQMPPDACEIFTRADSSKSLADWGLSWVMNHPEVSVVLSGMSSMEQLETNIKIAEHSEPGMLSDSEMSAIEKVKELFKSRQKIGCTGCGYCMPCPAGVNIPENFKLYNTAYLFNNLEHCKFSYGLLTHNQQAQYCKKCGRCEQHCPQGLPIMETLVKVHQALQGSNVTFEGA